MTDPTLERGESILKKEWDDGDSHWVKRLLAVTFCSSLVLTIGVVFTRVIAARVPEQRATLEKLITERTGLEVRFDNVHFAWDLDGTSAVFTRVELTDPAAGRVHVVAPELRVEFDTWDFLRHHQFSLGHVTLKSPDIEVIGDPEESLVTAVVPRPARAPRAVVPDEEAAVMHRYLGWAALMPAGRIEVEGARVHLKHRGAAGTKDGAPYHSFTLSQAVVSRSGDNFNAYGTVLLSQDVGQSLFVSAKLDRIGASDRTAGDLRFIARRVFLERLGVAGLTGRGTLDARLALRDGRVATGSWQASARDLVLDAAANGEGGTRFDHVSVAGKLAREGRDLLVDFSDLQLTRGARLERAPALNARLALEPDAVRIARTTVRAEKLPFMAAEFIGGLLAPRISDALPTPPGGWSPAAGELRSVYFDSGERRRDPGGWELTAQVTGAEFARGSDQARLSQLAARLRCDASGLTLHFDPATLASVNVSATQPPRALAFDGSVAVLFGDGASAWRFEDFTATSDAASVRVAGQWNTDHPLNVDVKHLDRALLQDAWTLLAAGELPAAWNDVEQGLVTEGRFELLAAGDGAVNWTRSRATLQLESLASAGHDMPRLGNGRGRLVLARGAAQLALDSGNVEDLRLTRARLDWPRAGAPRLQASLAGTLGSPLLREVLAAQGLERLEGTVELDAEARGERELRTPALWRVSARIADGKVPLAAGLPPVEKLTGNIRYAGQLRALALQGEWLGGRVEIESRRNVRGALSLGMNGVADAAPLLKLLGGAEAAQRVGGELAWNGTAERAAGTQVWQVTLGSNFVGVESRLPGPFEKGRARVLPVAATLHIGPEGIRDYAVDSGRDLVVRGQVRAGATQTHFEVQGLVGDLHRPANAGPRSELTLAALDLMRAPVVLAAAGALLPADGDLAVTIDDLRHADRSLGPLHVAIERQQDDVEFSLDSPAAAPNQISARGRCALEGECRADFAVETAQLAALLKNVQLPAEWPAESLRAAGHIEWPVTAADLSRVMAGDFDLTTHGTGDHLLTARVTLSDGQLLLADVQGTGPAPDQVFRGSGRIGLVARDYDLTVDYERVALAATAMPSPARARLARAWNAVRGSVARRGWTDAPETRRVQWHGSWVGTDH